MHDTARLVATLKKLLQAHGVTYAALASRIGLSEASVKRLFAQQTFTLRRLDEICAAIDVDFYELARACCAGSRRTRAKCSRAQETALAADPQLLATFYLVFNGWTF